jgi:hypothetical protein
LPSKLFSLLTVEKKQVLFPQQLILLSSAPFQKPDPFSTQKETVTVEWSRFMLFLNLPPGLPVVSALQ